MLRRVLISYVLVAGLIGFDPVSVLHATGGGAGLASGGGGAPITAETPPVIVDLSGVDLEDLHALVEGAEQTPDGLVADLPDGGVLVYDATSLMIEVFDSSGNQKTYTIQPKPSGNVLLSADVGPDILVLGAPDVFTGDGGAGCGLAVLVLVAVLVVAAIIYSATPSTR